MDLKDIVEGLRLSFNVLQQVNKLLGRDRATAKAKPAGMSAAVANAPVAAPNRERPRDHWMRRTGRIAVAGTAAGLAAYTVIRRQRRAVQRARPMHAPFPEELLDVLAAPGGGNALFYSGDGLIDPENGPFYPVVDGIPDFLSPNDHGGTTRRRVALPSLPSLPDALRHEAMTLVTGALTLPQQSAASALAGAMARAATGDWCLVVPCGTGAIEVEMARANPETRVLCLDPSWDVLREVRLRAVEAGLANLYVARGGVDLLPLQTGAFDSAWSANGFHFFPKVEQAIVELTRVVRDGGSVAGTSLVYGGGPADALMARMRGAFPGMRDVATHFYLLAAAGLRDLHGARTGPMVRFVGEKFGE